MAEMSLTLKIPALDRLCAILEGWEKEKPLELVTTKQPPLVEVPKTDAPATAPAALEGPKQPPEPAVAQSPAPVPEPAKPAPVAAQARAITVDDLMRAAAALRDAGGPPAMKAVMAEFPAFGIQKISDLKPDQFDAFAVKLRALGAEI